MPRLIRPLVLVVVAAVVGYLLARSATSSKKSPDALTKTAAATDFSVHYPSGWSTTDPASIPGLALQAPVAVGPTSVGAGRLAVGTIDAATVGSLPTSFLRSLPHRPRAKTVALGAFRYDRYLNLHPRGGRDVVSVYLLATTRSTIVATCASPTRSGTFTAQCERVLGTMRLPRGVAVFGEVDAAYALELNQILSTLNVARKSAAPGLLDSSLATRAASARKLAGAEARAADGAAKLSARGAQSANRVLVGALRQAAGGYRALATAADTRDQSGYVAAQATLTSAQRTLTSAFKTLSRLGYQLR